MLMVARGVVLSSVRVPGIVDRREDRALFVRIIELIFLQLTYLIVVHLREEIFEMGEQVLLGVCAVRTVNSLAIAHARLSAVIF